jgi:hypothetical protein
MKEIAPEEAENQYRLEGYGNSELMQGGFLSLFVIVMYGIQRNHRTEFLDQLSLTPMQEAFGLTLSLKF